MAAKTTRTTTEKKTTTKRPSRRPSSSASNDEMQHASFEPSREEIAQRAFELFLARGGEHGRHEEDWLRAEREVRERRGLS